jgi:hypothetical protein
LDDAGVALILNLCEGKDMDKIIETREIPIKGEYDIIIAGGGIAGVAAALAAKRLGSRVLLIEKSVMLGGLATLGLISWYEPLCDGTGRHIIKGIAEELLLLSIRYGPNNLPEDWKMHKKSTPDSRRYAANYSPAIFALALNDLMAKEGIDIRYDMLASYPIMEQKICKGLIVESKSGREAFEAKVVIDATGDADILYRGGVPCAAGRNFLSYVAHGCGVNEARKFVETGDALSIRKWILCGSNLNGAGHPEGLHTFSGTSNEDVTEFVRMGQQMLFDKIKEEPPTERDVIAIPGMAQYRTTRHIIGEYELTAADEEKHHEDSVGAIGDFRKKYVHYEIPYRCLYNKHFPNMLAAGRIISASGDGWEVTRVIPPAALTGQAAGVAAHIMHTKRQAAADVNTATLKGLLTEQGVMLHF